MLDSHEAVKLYRDSLEQTSKGAEGGKGKKLKPEQLILVREETAPDDIDGMIVAQGVLTARGGMTSHAAVVARGMGKPCVASCPTLTIDAQAGTATIGGQTFKAGDWITIDGTTGAVYPAALELRDPEFTGAVVTLLKLG